MQAALKLASRRARHKLARQALALLQQAEKIERRGQEVEKPEGPRTFPYRVHFFDGKGSVLARDAFICESDATAQKIANRLLLSCSDLFDSYELWSGARRIGGRKFTHAVRPAACDDNEPLDAWAQEIVLQRERILHESQARIAEGRRMVARDVGGIARFEE